MATNYDIKQVASASANFMARLAVLLANKGLLTHQEF